MDGDDLDTPSVSREQSLADQFYDWERRGRGWRVWDYPVKPEPPFDSFPGYFEPSIAVNRGDDGRRPTRMSRLVERLRGALAGKPTRPPIVDEDPAGETEPDPLEEPDSLVELHVLVPEGLAVGREMAEQFLLCVGGTSHPIAFELVGLPEGTAVQFVTSGDDIARIEGQLKAHFPEAAMVRRDSVLQSRWIGIDEGESAVVEFGLSREFMLPLAASRGFTTDVLTGIIGALGSIREGEVATVQVLLQPVRHAWAESALRSVVYPNGQPLFDSRVDYVSATKRKVSKPLYAVVLRVGARSKHEGRVLELIRGVAGALAPLDDPMSNELIPLVNDGYDAENHEVDLLLRRSRRSGMILNSDELVTIVHLPPASLRVPHLQRMVRHTKAAPKSVLGHPLVLGENEHGGVKTPVTLSDSQRTLHMHIIGASGTGKSNLLLNMIEQGMRRGEGMAVLDPHGDLVDEVIRRVPADRVDDVILFDPADEDFPVGFNILSAHSEMEKTLLASDLVGVFRRLSTTWGDQMNAVLSNAILAMLESDRQATLQDLRRFLVERDYREDFLRSVRDSEVVYYWTKEFPLLTGKPQASILTRLQAFMSPKAIRYMVGQRDSRLDFADIMDRGRIFLGRLSVGAIGEENVPLLGALLVAKFHQLILGRQRMQESERRPFWLYMDEFQHFATPSMATILSGVRKYGLGLVMAHHELQQLESKSSDLASAVLAHTHTRVCFKVGDQDAKKLAVGFTSFDVSDLQNLSKGEAICRVERADHDFNLRTFKVPPVDDAAAAPIRKAIIEHSRKKFAANRSDVEAMLLQDLQAAVEKPRTKPDRGNAAVEAPAKPVEPDQPPPPVEPAKTPPVEEPPREVEAIDVGTKPETPEASPPEPKPAAKPTKSVDREPAMMGRGGDEHRYLQQIVKQYGEQYGYLASIEYPIPAGGSVDVMLQKGNVKIACELSVTTDIAWELGNARKCLRAGYERVAMVCADPKRLERLREVIGGKLAETEKSLVQFFAPGDLVAYLQELEASQLNTVDTVGGYKVKVKFQSVDPREGQERRNAISNVIAGSVRRIRKKK